MYQHAKSIKYSKRFKSYSDFLKVITDGRTRLGEAIHKEIRHLTMVRSCQYVSACQKLLKYSERFESSKSFAN